VAQSLHRAGHTVVDAGRAWTDRRFRRERGGDGLGPARVEGERGDREPAREREPGDDRQDDPAASIASVRPFHR
jgi:hypothetical protein